MSANQCRQYILKTASRLRQFDLDDSSRNALDVYESYAKGRASFEDFYQACNSTYESLLSGAKPILTHLAGLWSDELIGAAAASWDVAWTIADLRSKASVAITCANATDEDMWGWGFSGVPDPVWQATRAAEEQYQAHALREFVGNPFRART
jgi:hypothetical protein